MNNKTVLLVLTIFLVLGGTIFLLPSDEKKIRGKLDSFAEYCSTSTKESVLETLQKATLAAKLCTVPCRVHIESLNIDRDFLPKEITNHLLTLKKRLPNTGFSFQDTTVDIQGEAGAEIVTTLRLSGESGGGRFTDAYVMNITVEKQDGDWLFSSFAVVEFMKK